MKVLTLTLKSMRLATLFLVASFLSVSQAFAGIEIQSWQTKEGARVMFVESNQLPILDVQITFDAGSARDGEYWGLASFTSDLFGVETQRHNEDEFSEAFNALGAQFSSSVNRDSATVSLRTLTRPEIQSKAISLVEEALAEAKFEQAIFNRERQRLLTGLKQKAVKPQVIASELLWQNIYGDHPYAHPVEGDEQTLPKLTLSQIQQFYQAHYTAKNAVIAIVGKVSKAEAQKIAGRLSSAMPTSDKRLEPISAPKALEKSVLAKQDFSSTQTYYHLAQLGIERGNRDYVPLFVGNHLFGGSGFGSYLMEEVREKRGLVYSVYSYFAPMKQSGPFIIGLSTKNSSALEAQKVVEETLENFLNDFDEEKFQATKDNLIGGWPLRFDANSKIIGYLSMIGFYDLPMDYLDWFPKAVEKVTKEDVLNAWRKHIHPQKMLTVMVGQPE